MSRWCKGQRAACHDRPSSIGPGKHNVQLEIHVISQIDFWSSLFMFYNTKCNYNLLNVHPHIGVRSTLPEFEDSPQITELRM